MDFNINDKVRVRLTPHGRAVHADSHDELFARLSGFAQWDYIAPIEDADGWSEWQMWSLMATFGSHMRTDVPQCFELNTIRIVMPTVGQN